MSRNMDELNDLDALQKLSVHFLQTIENLRKLFPNLVKVRKNSEELITLGFELQYIYSICAIKVESTLEHVLGMIKSPSSVDVRIRNAQRFVDEYHPRTDDSYETISLTIIGSMKMIDNIFLDQVVVSWKKRTKNKVLVEYIENSFEEAKDKIDRMRDLIQKKI